VILLRKSAGTSESINFTRCSGYFAIVTFSWHRCV
jgi:hypothetical protein